MIFQTIHGRAEEVFTKRTTDDNDLEVGLKDIVKRLIGRERSCCFHPESKTY